MIGRSRIALFQRGARIAVVLAFGTCRGKYQIGAVAVGQFARRASGRGTGSSRRTCHAARRCQAAGCQRSRCRRHRPAAPVPAIRAQAAADRSSRRAPPRRSPHAAARAPRASATPSSRRAPACRRRFAAAATAGVHDHSSPTRRAPPATPGSPASDHASCADWCMGRHRAACRPCRHAACQAGNSRAHSLAVRHRACHRDRCAAAMRPSASTPSRCWSRSPSDHCRRRASARRWRTGIPPRGSRDPRARCGCAPAGRIRCCRTLGRCRRHG